MESWDEQRLNAISRGVVEEGTGPVGAAFLEQAQPLVCVASRWGRHVPEVLKQRVLVGKGGLP